MTIERMNKMYGTDDTEDFGQVTWLLPIDMTDQEYPILFCITQPDGLTDWSTMFYEDGSYQQEKIWSTLTDAFNEYVRTVQCLN